MSAAIDVAAGLGLAGGVLCTWYFNSETDEQARLREERLKRKEEYWQAQEVYGGEALDANYQTQQQWREIKPPLPNTLRYECEKHYEDLPLLALNRVFKFSNEHTTGFNSFSTTLNITNDAEKFFKRISECQSEFESQMCILRFKEELEFKIKNSDIPDEYKQKFHRALNPQDYKKVVSGISLTSGIILAAYYANPVGLLASPAAYALVQLFCPEMRFFPTTYGAIADPNAFRYLIAELNNLISDAENDIRLKYTCPVYKI